MAELSESQKTILDNLKSLSNHLDNQVLFALKYNRDPNECIDTALSMLNLFKKELLPERKEDKNYEDCLSEIPHYRTT